MIYGVERAAARWARERRDRIGVGNISRPGGGPFPPHSSHREGVDVDVAPVRADGKELPVTIYDAQYSRAWTQRAIQLMREEIPTRTVLFNDSAISLSRFPCDTKSS